MKTVVIIGAGIGGLATANLLAKAGYQVTIYDKLNQAGGRAGKLEQDGFTFDTGPSWLLMQDVFQHYYQLLGKQFDTELDLVRLDPAYKVFYESEPPITITSNLERDSQSFEAVEAGAGAKLKQYVAGSQQTYDLALQHFLYTNFKRPSNLLHADILKNGRKLLNLAGSSIHRYVSGYFTDQRLQQIMEYQMVFLGVSPFKAPAIYNLMSTLDFQDGVYYPRGGMYTLIDSLVSLGRELSVEYHFNSPVAAVITTGKQATGIRLEDGTTIQADIVISNADLHHTETKLLPTEQRSYPASFWQRKKASPSAILLYLGIKGEIPELEHHNLLFVDDWKGNFRDITGSTIPDKASVYIGKSTATDPSGAPAGHENVFVLIPLPAGNTLTAQEQELLTTRYLRQIQQMTGVDLAGRAVSRTVYGQDYFADDLNSWQASMLGPAHSLGQSALFRPAVKSRKLSNLYYVGAGTRPGIGMPMCLISAELVYKMLAGDHSAGPVAVIKELA